MTRDNTRNKTRHQTRRSTTADPAADGELHAEPEEEIALVPRDGFFEGQIALVGRTRIDGSVHGSLQGPGELVLGPEARVEGRIDCESISSCGEMIGPVVARKRAHFGDGARFEGDLVTRSVEVDGDVLWNGAARVGGET